MQKTNHKKPRKKSFDLNLCVDPRLAKHMEAIKTEVHRLVKSLGDDSPGLLINSTTEVAGGGVLAYTTYVKGTDVIIVHPTTEQALIEAAFMSFKNQAR